MSLLLASGCLLGLEEYIPPDYTNEDAGTGYEGDLAGEDLVSGVVLPGHYHPVGYNAPPIHGRDLKLQVQDCRTCHGQNLNGGSAGAGGGTIAPPSCDTCHKASWRTDCTYCHGTAGGKGAPPRDLDGQTNPAKITFPGHTAHLSGRIAPSFDCIQCHRKPTDVLTPYHVFDASPRRGENNLSGGLSPQGVYDPQLKQCTNVYCHGIGRLNGSVSVDTPAPLSCSGCHADLTTQARWTQMSGDHRLHLNLGNVNCTHCHAGTVAADSGTVSNTSKHLDGIRQVTFNADAAGITYNAATRLCTGTCHGTNHNETW